MSPLSTAWASLSRRAEGRPWRPCCPSHNEVTGSKPRSPAYWGVRSCPQLEVCVHGGMRVSGVGRSQVLLACLPEAAPCSELNSGFCPWVST